MPNVKKLMAEGSYTLKKRSVLPSSSAVNWGSMYMLIVLSSCNNDVFVDELKVSDTDIQMSGEGDSIIVEMSTPVWDIYTVNFEKEVSSTRSYLNENDSISYNGVVKGFTVKRTDDRHLSIRVDENLSKEDFKFNITMEKSGSVD